VDGGRLCTGRGAKWRALALEQGRELEWSLEQRLALALAGWTDAAVDWRRTPHGEEPRRPDTPLDDERQGHAPGAAKQVEPWRSRHSSAKAGK
jgi:hypothetical protein